MAEEQQQEPSRLQTLIDKLAENSDADLGEMFAELTVEELSTMDTDGVAAFDAIRRQDEGLTADDVAKLETIATAVDRVRAETARREQASAELASRVDELATKLAPAVAETDDGGEPAEQPAPEPVVEPAAAEAETSAPAAELVLASGTPAPVVARRSARVDLAAVRARQPETAGRAPERAGGTVSIVAAGDVPGFAAGQRIDSTREIAEALTARFKAMPIGAPGVTHRAGVAVFRRNLPAELVASGKNDMEVVDYAADERRLPGGSLIAAVQQRMGSLTAATIDPSPVPQDNWCSPSETDYTLCTPLESDFGMLDLPTIQVRRGGIRYPKAISWPDLYASVTTYAPPDSTDPASGTGAQILPPDGITGPLDGPAIKHCITIPCPEWAEERLHAAPFCVDSEIPMETAWPELVDQYVQRALIARQHRINAYLLNEIETRAKNGFAVVAPDSLSASWTVFDAIRLYASWYRDLNRMPAGATLETILPAWVKELIKADMGKRVAVGADIITDAQVAAQFLALGIRVQWVRDWQDLATVTVGGTPEAPTFDWPMPTGWPDQLRIVMYPAGTFVRGVADIIRLDAIYDSQSLLRNRYMKTFMEDGLMIVQRCYAAMHLTVNLCMNGLSGGLGDATCLMKAVAPAPAPTA